MENKKSPEKIEAKANEVLKTLKGLTIAEVNKILFRAVKLAEQKTVLK
jgi:hypothetical protein